MKSEFELTALLRKVIEVGEAEAGREPHREREPEGRARRRRVRRLDVGARAHLEHVPRDLAAEDREGLDGGPLVLARDGLGLPLPRTDQRAQVSLDVQYYHLHNDESGRWLLRALRDAGCAILLVSTELEEILALSDRVIVMNQGRVTGELAIEDCTEAGIGLLMTGGPQ